MFDGWFAPRYPERHRVVVSTTEDTDFSGILWAKLRDELQLKDAAMVKEHGTTLGVPVKIDHDLFIPRAKVLCYQVLQGMR